MNLKKWHKYSLNSHQYMEPYYAGYDTLQSHSLSVKKNWVDFKRKRPVLAALLVRMFGIKSIEAHLFLDIDITETQAGEMLTTLEEFKDNTFSRLQKPFLIAKE